LIIEYDNIEWKECKSGYFQALNKYNVNGKYWLHQYKYEKEIGPIVEGHHIHHRDGNKRNNKIANLLMLSASEHSILHNHNKKERFPEWYKKQCEHLNRIRPTYVWPKDSLKYEEHRKALKEGMQKSEYIKKNCKYCGEEYKSRKYGRHLFCSNKCKSAYRRKNGLDNIDRICIICDEPFITNKYSKTVTCSRKCADILHWRNRINAVC
jgi:hypothetical protein